MTIIEMQSKLAQLDIRTLILIGAGIVTVLLIGAMGIYIRYLSSLIKDIYIKLEQLRRTGTYYIEPELENFIENYRKENFPSGQFEISGKSD